MTKLINELISGNERRVYDPIVDVESGVEIAQTCAHRSDGLHRTLTRHRFVQFGVLAPLLRRFETRFQSFDDISRKEYFDYVLNGTQRKRHHRHEDNAAGDPIGPNRVHVVRSVPNQIAVPQEISRVFVQDYCDRNRSRRTYHHHYV